MKKRFLIPAVVVAALTGLAVYGNNIQKTCVPGNTDYENGTGICSAKNRAADNTATTAKAKADQPSAEQALYNLNVKIETAAMNCEKAIKPTLKDPRSFRKVGHDLVDISDGNLTVSVSYIATNSFGGPARGAQSCTYSL